MYLAKTTSSQTDSVLFCQGATTVVKIRRAVVICGPSYGFSQFDVYPSFKSRSLCSCREGLDKPPLLRRRGSGPPTSEQPLGKATKSSNSSISKIKKENTDSRASNQIPKTAKNAIIRQDAGVKLLEDLHERTKGTNVNISKGGRLKLPDSLGDSSSSHPSSSGPKSRPTPTFDLNFADLLDVDPEGSTRDIDELAGDSDLSDELPEPGELLKTGGRNTGPALQAHSDSTSYSNSEMEALIAHAPLGDLIDLTGESDRAEGTRRHSPVSSSKGHKRTLDDSPNLPAKRVKLPVGSQVGTMIRLYLFSSTLCFLGCQGPSLLCTSFGQHRIRY